MWCWRRMKKISLSDRVRNEEVLRRVKEERNIHTVKRRKANSIGHILRRNCLINNGIEGKLKGKIYVRGRRVGDVSSYWMNLRRQEVTVI
jgi:hypothetical protein